MHYCTLGLHVLTCNVNTLYMYNEDQSNRSQTSLNYFQAKTLYMCT